MSISQTENRDLSARRFATLPRLLFLAGALLLLTWLGLKVWRVARLAQSLQEHQVQAESLASRGLLRVDPDQAESLVMDLRRDIVALDRELRPFLPLATRLGWLPRVGPLLRHSEPLMEMANAGSQAAAYAVRGLKPALYLLQEDLSPGEELVPRLLPSLQESEADLLAASTALERAIAARSTIESLDGFPWRVRTLLEMVDGKLYLADELRLLTVMPAIMGIDGPKTYLILAQNEDEIRPTGGFLTGAGLLTVAGGDIVDLTFQDGNVIDDWRNKPYELPPDPLYHLMGLELFLFRDANFWPDFPTSAKQAIQLYSYGQDNAPQLDGAIAIDQRFVAMLVSVTGPIRVPQLEATVSSGNVVASLRDAWGAGEDESHADWIRERKDFLGPLAQALRARLLGEFESIDPLFLAETMHLAAQQKHLQIYVDDPDVARVLDQIAWDGRLELPSKTDYLMVVDTNVGYNKVNPLVESAINYEVELHEDGTGTATLNLHYVHKGQESAAPCAQIVPYVEGITYESLMNRCYWNYLRIYAPSGISPIRFDEHPLEEGMAPVTSAWTTWTTAELHTDEAGTVIANAFVLPQGESLTSRYEFSLPVVVTGEESKTYSLEVKKQAGLGPQQITIAVTVPPDSTVVRTSPSAHVEGRRVTFEVELVTDSRFEISYR